MLFDDDDSSAYERPEYSRPTSNAVKTLVFVMIASILIVFTDLVILDGKQYIWKQTQEQVDVPASGDISIDAYSLQNRHARYLAEGITLPSDLKLSESNIAPSYPDPAELNVIEPAVGTQTVLIEESSSKTEKSITDVLSALKADKDISVLKEESIAATIADSQSRAEVQFALPEATVNPRVAIIIDDMGVTLRSKIVEVMDGPLTLAYLPYVKNLPERTARAKVNGHELMVHMPMEAMNKSLDGGPRVLSGDLTYEEFSSTLEWGLLQFEGYVGVNNHMGSRLTQNREAMGWMMERLRDRDVYFVDSKTIATSVAADVAADYGLSHAERDVFLDHEISKDFVRNALKKLERVAYKKGYAIAIGHPHAETIEVLKEWLPTLAEKNIELVPASALVTRPVRIDAVAVR